MSKFTRLLINSLTSKAGRIVHIPGSKLYDLKGVTMVLDINKAKELVRRLMKTKNSPTIHAIDTEFESRPDRIRASGLISNVLAMSIYTGPHWDWGGGPRIYVDCLVPGVLKEFKPYLEDPAIPKIVHNYAADLRALYESSGIKLRGLAGDTLHLARLYDTSRKQLETSGVVQHHDFRIQNHLENHKEWKPWHLNFNIVQAYNEIEVWL